MKILFISHYAEMLGANRSLLGLVEGMISKGVDCVILCPKKGDFTNVLDEKGINYEHIPFQNWADTFLFPGFWLLPLKHLRNKQLMPRLTAFVQKVNPDIIHTNSSVAPVGAYLSERHNIPHIWHIREFGKLDYNMRFFPSRENMITWMKKATKVIAISKAIQKEVIGDQFSNWEIIYNGVLNRKKVLHLQQINLDHNPQSAIFKFLIIGMIHPAKNQMEALRAFMHVAKKKERVQLDIVGIGRKVYMEQLKDLVWKEQLTEKVILHGYVKNPESIFIESDAVLMCSRNEGMGRVTAEAMAYGKPVIGYNGGATPELIDHEVNGFVYKKEEELAKRMIQLVDNPDTAKEMGQKGREKALNEFTVDRYVEKVYKVYMEVLKIT